ncbi:MAG: cytochrome c peroxidase [Pseudomonadota bacterium]
MDEYLFRTAIWAATLALLTGLVGCADERADEFRNRWREPVMLGIAWDRDVTNPEPLRALSSTTLPPADDAKVRLGQMLFHDATLSRDGTVSCASCHVLAKGGDDDRAVSLGIDAQEGAINAPTVLNAALNFRQFWDGRASNLIEQARAPVENPAEMGSDWLDVISKLEGNPNYALAFAAAFGDEQITVDRVVNAIAVFERTLITPAPFDRYLAGDADAISLSAKEGYTRFKALGCVACHQGINVGGNLFQKFGAIQAAFEVDSDADRGRENVTRSALDRGVFKVPSLRNVVNTAPYFHDGSVARLQDAVRIMGAVQLGRNLSDDDVNSLVDFLKTLSGEVPDGSRPSEGSL